MIKIYTSEECVFCKKLKTHLEDEKIEYVNVDIRDDHNTQEVDTIFDFVTVSTKTEPSIPIISVDGQLLIPNVSFKTIKEGVELLKKLIK